MRGAGAAFSVGSHTNSLVSHLGKAFARLRLSRTIGDRLRYGWVSWRMCDLELAIKTVTKGVAHKDDRGRRCIPMGSDESSNKRLPVDA